MLSEVPTLQSLKQEQCLWAVVVGVADFGAFVELGPDCSGLIHISRLSAHYVEDPHQAVQVGDLLKVWVVSIDEKKNRVALTALSPAERRAANQERNERGGGSGRDFRDQRGSRDQGGRSGGQGGQRPQGDRAKQGSRPSGGGRPSGSGGRPGRSGSGNRDRHGGGRGNRRDERRTSKPIIVQSKKPKENISAAMKEGEEPLRSFSDLMQFYEAKRTDPPTPAPKGDKVRPASEAVEQENITAAATETQIASDSSVTSAPAEQATPVTESATDQAPVEANGAGEANTTSGPQTNPDAKQPAESDSAS